VQRLAALSEQALARQARLDELERERRAERAHLVEERVARRRVLASLGAQLSHGRRQMKILKADEARLARLVEELARVVPPEPGEKKFSRLRGRLRLPVRGEPIGRFGGLFIRTPEGQPVRAIARGRVVYADWMRGFGNLLILDHGENYLTIYANNEALLKQVGDVVEAGARGDRLERWQRGNGLILRNAALGPSLRPPEVGPVEIAFPQARSPLCKSSAVSDSSSSASSPAFSSA
jgi:septal ring factor EnvC (AmiA/AmiB activator)